MTDMREALERLIEAVDSELDCDNRSSAFMKRLSAAKAALAAPGEPVAWLADAAQPTLRRDDLVEGGFTDAEIYPLYRDRSRTLDIDQAARIIDPEAFEDAMLQDDLTPTELLYFIDERERRKIAAREKAAALTAPAGDSGHGFIISNGNEDRFRFWGAMGPEWTTDRNEALRFARRVDAERFSENDEDAWKILEVGAAERDADEDETYEIGKRDGYGDAIQDLDLATGGDGEFRGSTIPGRTVDVPTMKARIIGRFASLRATSVQGGE